MQRNALMYVVCTREYSGALQAVNRTIFCQLLEITEYRAIGTKIAMIHTPHMHSHDNQIRTHYKRL